MKIINLDNSKNAKRFSRRLIKNWFKSYYEILNKLVDLNSSIGQQFYDDIYQNKIVHAFDGKENLYTYRKLRNDQFKTQLDYDFENTFKFKLKITI